jgi:ribosomal protein S18 acetylase RimI-like enzyme
MREFSFIAEHDGVICGRISGEVDTFNSTLRINGLIVNSEIRGTGAGRLLMDAAESLGIAAGCHLCFVNTTESTAPGFYDKLGYRRIASVNDYPVPGDTYYYYFKQIS